MLAPNQTTRLNADAYPGLPRDTVVIESAGVVFLYIDADNVPDISHDRSDGVTLIHFQGEWRNLLPTVIRPSGTFRHRLVGVGTVEVNVIPELPPFASASRNAMTPADEERVEVTHAAAYLGFYGPFGSKCSRMDWHAAGVR